MPYVTVPKDFRSVKTKMVFNLTKRQLVCFSAAALLGLPVFFLSRHALGNHVSLLLMIVVMLPLFFLAMYERDGLPAEKIAANILRTKFLWPAVRVYETDNLYGALQKQVDFEKEAGFDIREKKETEPPVKRGRKAPVKTGGPRRKRW